jgi:hypothetical protein
MRAVVVVGTSYPNDADRYANSPAQSGMTEDRVQPSIAVSCTDVHHSALCADADVRLTNVGTIKFCEINRLRRSSRTLAA